MSQVKHYSSRKDKGEVVIAGTLCKEMQLRPNALVDFKFRIGSVFGPPLKDLVDGENLCSDDDSLTLEDETLKVELDVAAERVAQLCTGMVVCAKGVALPNGKFQVNDISFPGLLAPALPLPSQTSSGTVALISGLDFPMIEEEKKPVVDRLIQWFQQEHAKGGISHAIVCGGTLSARTLKDKAQRMAGVAEADEFYSRLAAILPLDLMPSRQDPTNLSIPQRPINSGLFKRTRQMKDFQCVSNPYETNIEGLRLLGHGGDPVKDVLRCTQIATPIEALETCLDARHLAPTAPDTLEAAPVESIDPFVIDEVPHVMFSGGHPKPEHKWCSVSGSAEGAGTLCVCVPAFYSHPAVVTVCIRDPRNVTVHEI
jgi:DNA polymerase delta subunit 2